jgi:integrase/recombinase XerD
MCVEHSAIPTGFTNASGVSVATTAWRYVKTIIAAAGIAGTPAMPKGPRHGFGVSAFQANVPPHLVQRWLEHASLRTTSIYGDVMGAEERAFAARMWTKGNQAHP